MKRMIPLLLVAACGTPPSVPPATPPAASSAVDEQPAPAPAVSAEPDPPRAEDLERVAALAPPAIAIETAPVFSPDGRDLVFVATYGAARALYVLRVGADEPPRRVVDVSFRYRRPVVSPDGRYVYFTSDQGGDEAYSIRRVELATGAVEDVAAGGGLRRDGPWFVDGGELMFTGRAMGGRGAVVFRHRSPDPARVYEDEAAHLLDVRRDGREALFARLPLHDALFVVDLVGGTARQIHPADGATRRVRVFGARYAHDGRRVYVATDDGGERSHVLAMDPRSGRELTRYTEPNEPSGDLQSLRVSRSTIAFVVDRGTHHEARVLDARRLTPRPQPALPLGSEVPGANHPNSTPSVALSPDGTRMALEWSTPSSPRGIRLVDTRTGAVSTLGASEGSPTVAIASEIVRIPSFDGLEIPTLIHRPETDDEARPVVMLIHGGFPYAATARYDSLIAALLAEGYAVVEPNVRGSGGFGAAFERADDGEGKLLAVRDFRAVGEHVAAQPWADGARLAVMGSSAGGYYTLMVLAHQPDLWRAGVALVPMYDLAETLRTTDGDLREFFQHELAPASEPERLARLSPSTYIDRVQAPLFVYAGANDARTPLAQIEALVRDARGHGVAVEFMLSADQGHARDDVRTQRELRVRILRFLRESLDGTAHRVDG